jgi:hypothetical protein
MHWYSKSISLPSVSPSLQFSLSSEEPYLMIVFFIIGKFSSILAKSS